ncbi:serine/threonine-protein kinase [Fodinicola acaciae]|uniref:serine/threonine-protein kinase n=1 Tax=Fodinicola acaciae TaxID=2681555 RepID=UPI0013D3C91D|nr:serine/threonine-protein kinase [Fodinicola acaciae]
MSGPPAQIGRYLVERQLGSGGMGEVYLAYSPAGDPVAVKLIRTDRLDPVTRARFEKEAQIARTIIGTNRVAKFLDADPYADRPWLAMEYIAGDTLLAHVDAHGPLSAPMIASLGALLSEGLAAVHDAKLLHRDIKPQNVIMGEYGPILIDFGLGAFLDAGKESIASSGMIIGTVRCMAPEQATGNSSDVTTAADVYGLGSVLLYAATGHYPYEGLRWEAIVAQVRDPTELPDLHGLPDPLLPIVSSMLAYDPDSRPHLAAVTSECARLLTEFGMSPADARYALLDRTTKGPGAETRNSPSAALPERLGVPAIGLAAAVSIDSPLDRPVQAYEDADDATSVDALIEKGAPRDVVRGEPEPFAASDSRRRRQPASERVAEELRKKYDVQPGL